MSKVLGSTYIFVALKTNTPFGRPWGWIRWQHGATNSSTPLILMGAQEKAVIFVTFYRREKCIPPIFNFRPSASFSNHCVFHLKNLIRETSQAKQKHEKPYVEYIQCNMADI